MTERNFVEKFDCSNRDHVKWLQKMTIKVMPKLNEEQRGNLLEEINDNPIPGATMSKDDILNWAQLHFVISMKYTTAVLQGSAWTPSRQTQDTREP